MVKTVSLLGDKSYYLFYGIGPDKCELLCVKIMNIFLVISLNMCFGCSKEASHRDRSFEYPQHKFWLRNKKNNVQLCTLNWRSGIYPFINL